GRNDGQVLLTRNCRREIPSSTLKGRFFWQCEGMIVSTGITMDERQEGMTTGITIEEGIIMICTEKGYHTNDCIQLRRQMEMALKLRKLNHLVKDVRQREKKSKASETTEAWMNTPVTFPLFSTKDVSKEPLIIKAEVEGYLIKRVYVDEGASVEFMFEHCFENLNPAIKERLKDTQIDLVGFAGEVTKPLGKFLVGSMFWRRGPMDENHNEIPRQQGNSNLGHAVCHHLGVVSAREEAMIEEKPIEEEKENEGNMKEIGGTKEVLVNLAFPDQFVIIEGRLSEECKSQLMLLLKEDMEIFAWEPADKKGTKAKVTPHSLCKPNVERDRKKLCSNGEASTFFTSHDLKKPIQQRDDTEAWTLFTDGASSLKGSGSGLVLIGPSGVGYTYALHLTFVGTNNEVEYEALLAGLRIERKLKVDNWMTPIIKCLEKGIWLEDKNEARCLRVNIHQYVMEEGVLFKKSYLVPMLRCVGPLQANYVIREIHMRAYGRHSDLRLVVAKAMRQGYYRPTLHKDVMEEIHNYDSCQIHALVPKLPKTLMTSIMAPWPFYQWVMNILRPIPQASRRVKFVIVAINYFTKWIKAKPIIVTDNGTQFVNDPFKSWYTRLNIQQRNTVIAHPQANGLVERANKSFMEVIKTMLERDRAGWVDELPNTLWVNQTSLK
nr:reverse transcriptase domain-containing protein [Tanacetum cinerariifolium]